MVMVLFFISGNTCPAASMLLSINDSSSLLADVPGSWGCRAWYSTLWFQLEWTNDSTGLNIAVKELIPIIIGERRGQAHDNSAVVAIVNRAKKNFIKHMLCRLFFVEGPY